MQTTPQGWIIAFGVMAAVVLIKMLWLRWRSGKKRVKNEFLKKVSETNDIDGLIDLLQETNEAEMKDMIKRKLNRIVN